MQARIEPTRLRYVRRTLRRWFEAHGRDLPWRRTRDPYRIMVSEILLHQTQAPRVAEVYEEFLAEFPTIDHVAAAQLKDVKRITDPLGYKIRGQWIKQIADEVVTYRAGQLPDTTEDLMALPGVGRYTAGAIMTFAHEVPTPILDTNVARVLSRWFGGTLPQRDGAELRSRRLWALAGAVLPQGNGAAKSGWSINQALMDLGAQVCTARNPHCDVCPFRRRCHEVREDHGRGERAVVRWVMGDEPRPGRARLGGG
jgi:A/G-specific adenine glycosylase